jgi:Protein of unknown function (DUF2384)
MTHRSALPLPNATVDRTTPANLALMTAEHPPIAPCGAEGEAEAALLDFDDHDVIADIVPVPPSIPGGIRDALAKGFALRFNGNAEQLHRWLHEAHPALRGASPFETLVAGDGVGVLRALIWPGSGTLRRGTPKSSAERRETVLRLLR